MKKIRLLLQAVSEAIWGTHKPTPPITYRDRHGREHWLGARPRRMVLAKIRTRFSRR